MLGYFDFSALAAGGESLLNVRGSYFRYNIGSAGGADTRIIVRADGGLYAILKPGQAVRLPEGLKVGNWRIENYLKAGNILGTVSIGEGWIDDNTITGDVTVIDGGLSRTLAGVAFMGVVAPGVVAAQYAHGQLWNPPGSGKNLFVEAYSISSAYAQGIALGRHNVAEAIAGAAVFNKSVGGAVGVGVLRWENSVSALVTGYARVVYVAANLGFSETFKEPVMIPPGQGFVAHAQVVNTNFSVNYEWYEVLQ